MKMYFDKMYDVNPEDWKFVAAFTRDGDFYVCYSGDKHFDYSKLDICRCDHCNHLIVHFVILQSVVNSDFIVVGWDCYNETFSQSSREELNLYRAKKSAEAHAQNLEKRERLAAYEKNNPEIVKFLTERAGGNAFYSSLLDNLYRYGSLTERQAAAVVKNMNRVEPEKIDITAPTGKGKYTFNVLKLAYYPGPYGNTYKFTGKHNDGWRVFATVPACIAHDIEVGQNIEITLTLKASNSVDFVFGERPGRDAKIL
jgi:hypothetical protein